MLGDIILARGVCAAEAAEKAIPIDQHAAHLMVHGTLHLLGYDHMDDDGAADMEAREVRALARLGIADPYARRSLMATRNEEEGGSRLWRGMRACCSATTMRRRCATRSRKRSTRPRREPPKRGDLSPLERQMLRNLLHFGDRTVGEVAVTRGDIVSVPSTISFEELDPRLRRGRAQPPAGHRRRASMRSSA